MAKHHTGLRVSATDCRRVGGGLMIGALASGAFALALSSAGQANATCVSAGGWFTLGHGCETTAPGDFALAIGPGATATASGGLNTAISWGAGANATAEGVHNVAIGAGLGATAEAIGGHDNTAIAIGDPSTGSGGGGTQNNELVARRTVTTARAGLPAEQRADTADLAAQPQYSHNTAIAIGNGAQAGAGLGNNNFASAVGADSRAITAGGDNNKALVFGDRSQAVAGEGGVVATSPTPYLTSDLAVSRPQSNNNIAIVRGNDSTALAGGGDNNKAFVFGDRSHATAGRVVVASLLPRT